MGGLGGRWGRGQRAWLCLGSATKEPMRTACGKAQDGSGWGAGFQAQRGRTGPFQPWTWALGHEPSAVMSYQRQPRPLVGAAGPWAELALQTRRARGRVLREVTPRLRAPRGREDSWGCGEGADWLPLPWVGFV